MSRATELARLALKLMEQGRDPEQAIAGVIRQALGEQIPRLEVSKHAWRCRGQHQVLELIRSNGWTSTGLVSGARGVGSKTARKLLRTMVLKGMIVRTTDDRYVLPGPKTGRPITSTHPRAAYWREYKRRSP